MQPPPPPPEPGKWKAAIESAVVFALTMFALLWGVSFSVDATTQASLEHLSLLPPEVQPAPLPPPPKAEAPKPKPKPAPKPKPKPAPKPKPKPAQPDAADIALKQKQEEEAKRRREEEQKRKREEAEQKKREEEERKKREEEERKQREEEERQKREEQERRQAEEQKERDEEAKRHREEEEQRRLEEEERKRQAAEEQRQRLAAAERDREIARIAREVAIDNERGRVKDGIRRRIEREHSHPQSVPDDADIEVIIVFRLATMDGGRAELSEKPRIVKPSGDDDYDNSVLKAIQKAGVFPFPQMPELTDEFLGDITLRMSPRDR